MRSLAGGFVAGPLAPTNAAGISIAGNIASNGLSGAGGSVSIRSDSNIHVTGSILTSWFLHCNKPPQGGGGVNIDSLYGGITVTKAITTSGVAAKASFEAGVAGNITLNSLFITSGSLIAVGGSNTLGDGGTGGTVTIDLITDPNTPVIQAPNGSGGTTPESPASVAITGFINTQGGKATGKTVGNGGDGGSVSIDAALLAVKGTTAGASIITSAGTQLGTGRHESWKSGQVTINTYALQTMPSNLDLTSTKATIPVLAGGLFTVSGGAPVNGVAGKIVIGTPTQGELNVIAGNPFNGTNIRITVTGGDQTINEGSNSQTQYFILNPTTNKRDLLTPSEAVRLFPGEPDWNAAAKSLSAARIASGGSAEFDQTAANGNPSGIEALTFTAFNLGSASLAIEGPTPYLNLKTGLNLNSQLAFITTGAMSTINANAGAVTINSNGDLVGDNVILSGTNGTWTNNGTI